MGLLTLFRGVAGYEVGLSLALVPHGGCLSVPIYSLMLRPPKGYTQAVLAIHSTWEQQCPTMHIKLKQVYFYNSIHIIFKAGQPRGRACLSVCLSVRLHAILTVRAITSKTKDTIMLSVEFEAFVKRRFS